MFKKYLPVILAIILYVLIYFIRLNQGGWEPQIDLFKDFRTDLDKKIASSLPSPQAELLSGILLGQNKNLPGQFKLALRDTSTLHIVVASGQNLSMVAAFFLLLTGLIKRQLAITLSFIAIISYTFLTGVQVPILRAALMVSAGFIAQVNGREKESIWVVIVVGALMLLINPSWITSLSFQLSFLATLGVVGVSPILIEKLKFLPQFIRTDLAVSLAAQALVLPVIAQNFHQISLVALPTNIMVLWTIPLIMIGGAILLVVSFIQPLALLVALSLNVMLTYFIYIVQFFSSLSWSWIYIGEQIWIVWIGYYLIILAILMVFQKKNPEVPNMV